MTQAFVYQFLKYFTAATSKVFRQYQAAYYCSGSQYLVDGKLKSSNLCKTRMCHKCACIRTANLINGYAAELEPIMKRKNLYFLTLTIPTVHWTQAKKQFDLLYSSFDRIRKSLNKKVGRGIMKKFRGVRKLEFTHGQAPGHVHLHFHLLVEGKRNAEYLMNKWLIEHPSAKEWCQDIKLADKNSLKEMFKYLSKPTFKIKDTKNSIERTVYLPNEEQVQVFNACYEAVKGRRLVQPFGGLKKVSEEVEEEDEDKEDEGFENLVAQELGKFEGKIWEWDRNCQSYVSEYGELLATDLNLDSIIVACLCNIHHEPPPPFIPSVLRHLEYGARLNQLVA